MEIKLFLRILGFSGAPTSFAGIKNFLFRLTSIGNIEKNTINWIIRYIVTSPIVLNLPPYIFIPKGYIIYSKVKR